MTVAVSRKARFSAAHHFYLPELSAAQNFEKFGKTSNRYGHGHNYQVEITVEGEVDAATGMVVNLTDLRRILDEDVVAHFDFKHLNVEIPFFQENLPTLENLAVYIWRRIETRLSALGLDLACVKVWEADDLYVEYFGEELLERPA